MELSCNCSSSSNSSNNNVAASQTPIPSQAQHKELSLAALLGREIVAAVTSEKRAAERALVVGRPVACFRRLLFVLHDPCHGEWCVAGAGGCWCVGVRDVGGNGLCSGARSRSGR